MLLVHKDIQHMPITELENSESVYVKVFVSVGIGHLMALVKTSICPEISLTISGTNIKISTSPRFMF